MNLKNLRLIEKSLSGKLTPKEERYLEKLKENNPGITEQLDDFGEIRKAFITNNYSFAPSFATDVISSLEAERARPVPILFADIFQKAFMRVAVAGVSLLLVMVTLFSINQRKQSQQYPVEMLLASESLLFDYYYYEMN